MNCESEDPGAVDTAAQLDGDLQAWTGEFAELTKRKRELEGQVRGLNSRLGELEGQNSRLGELEGAIVREFKLSGTESLTTHGMTLYVSRDLAVSSVDGTDAVIMALRKARMGEMIGVNHPRLKAWLKERMTRKALGTWEVDPMRLPPSLRTVLRVEEGTSLRARAK